MSAHRLLKDLYINDGSSAHADYTYADPGDAGEIKPDRQFANCPLVSAGAETRTLKDPSFPGQRLTLAMKTDGGDITVTADSNINQTGNDTITFNDAGDTVVLEGIEDGSDLEWRVVVNDGASLS